MRRRKAGVANCSLDTDRVEEGVLFGCEFRSRLCNGVVMPINSSNNILFLDELGVRLNRPVLGVVRVSSLITLFSELRLLGVASTGPALGSPSASVGLDGVADKRSKRPRTRPSLCGVGPIEVGRAGLKSFLDRDGVTATDSSSACDCDLSGVWACLDRFWGVVVWGRATSSCLRFRCFSASF